MSRTLKRWLRSSVPSSPQPAKPRRAQLGVETLEAREVPSGNPIGLPFDVSGTPVVNQRAGGEHTIARAANGNFVAVWEGTGDSGSGVYARLFNASGSALTSATRIAGTDLSSSEATVAMNESGSFVVAWTQFSDVRAQRFGANGQAIGSSLAVGVASNLERSPTVGIDAAGNFAVAYNYYYSSTDIDLLLHRYRADGTDLGIRTIANSGVNEFDASLAMNATGQMVVSYTKQYSATDMDVYAQRLDTQGNLVGSAVAIDTSGLYDHDTSAAIDRNGNFIVAYTKGTLANGVVGSTDIYAQRVRTDGTLDGAKIVVASTSLREEAASVALVDYGGFAVGYSRLYTTGFPGTPTSDVLVQYYTSTAAPDGLTTVAGSFAHEENATVAFDRLGQLAVGYTSTNGKTNGATTGAGVYARLYGLTPSLSVSDASLDDSTGTVFRDGALRYSYDLTGSALAVSQTVLQAIDSQGNAITLTTSSGARVTNGLVNLANVSGLSAGTYQIRVWGILANGQSVYTPSQTLRIVGGATVRGTFQGETFTYNTASGTGASFFGAGGSDTLYIDALRTDVARINGLAVSSFTGQVNAQAIYRGSAWDFLRMNDGREAYFQGIERLLFRDGSVMELTQRPNDPAFASQWNLHVTDVDSAWRFTTGASNVLLVSLDTGVNVRAGDDLVTSRLVLDATDNDNSGDHGHNSISIMAAATNNASGIAGINRTSQVLVADVYSGVSLQQAIQDGITFARAVGWKVVFQGGIQGEFWLNSGGTQAQLETLLRNSQDVALFAVAAGNGNVNVDATTGVNTVYSAGVARLASTHSNVMSVGALERTGTTVNGLANASAVNKAGYSNFGYNLTLMAPTDSPAINGLGQINPAFNGTSAANPNLAAISSLVWSANTALTGNQVRQILVDTAMDIGIAGRDSTFGNGLVNTDAAVRRAVALGRAADVANLWSGSAVTGSAFALTGGVFAGLAPIAPQAPEAVLETVQTEVAPQIPSAAVVLNVEANNALLVTLQNAQAGALPGQAVVGQSAQVVERTVAATAPAYSAPVNVQTPASVQLNDTDDVAATDAVFESLAALDAVFAAL